MLAPRNIIAVVTRCSDQGCQLKFGDVVKLFNYISVEALVNIRSLGGILKLMFYNYQCNTYKYMCVFV